MQWRRGGADRERFIGHLASCASCREALAALVRDGPVPESPATLRPHEFVARGYAAQGRPRAVLRMRALIGAALVAAASLAVAMLRPFSGPMPLPAPIESAGVRGGDIQLLGPSGPVTEVREFRWSSPVAATRYRLQVRDDGGAVVHETLATSERTTLPEEARARLRPGRAYSWRVEALDGAGEVILASRPLTFRIAP